ncbi:grpE protein homolog 2, mitochondrial-like [Wolffia australiana]
MAARILRRLSAGGGSIPKRLSDVIGGLCGHRYPLISSSIPTNGGLRNTTILFNFGGPQRFAFCSSCPLPEEKEAEEQEDSDSSNTSKRTRSRVKRVTFSDDSDDERDLSVDGLSKLVAEKEELLKRKHAEIEKMQEKVHRSYADIENVLDRTKRETENSKKFAIQNFAKSLLDVADNLGRASSVAKERSSKMDPSQDPDEVLMLLKTLLEGVEMTEKQLHGTFRKFGVEKFDPSNENFDPHKHFAVFEIQDDSKLAGTVGAVLKAGYTLHERVLRPAEVGVIKGASTEPAAQDTDQ